MPTRNDSNPNTMLAARRRDAVKRSGKTSGRGSGLTPRIKHVIELLVRGQDDAGNPILKKEDAARVVGISDRAIRKAWLSKAVRDYFRALCEGEFESEKAASIRTMAEIRDDETLKRSPAGRKVQLDAAKTFVIDPRPASSVDVNVGINVGGVVERPGYIIDLSGYPDEHTLAPLTIDLEPDT